MNMIKNIEILQINSSNLLRLLALTIILAFIMPVMTNAQGGKTNFAGNWVFNASKSNMGTVPAPGGPGGGGGRDGGGAGVNFTATQDANLLTVTTILTDQDGKPVTRELKYTLDFKPSVNITAGRGGGAGSPATSYAKWSDDGKTLRIVTKTVGNGATRTTEEWTLINANTLSRTSSSVSGTGQRRTVAVYVRK